MVPFIKRCLLSSVVFLACACGQKESSDIILDVKQIANKRPEQVVKLLGEPDSTYYIRIFGRSIFCQLYKPHNIEIQYPETLATDIVIYGPHGLPFSHEALKAFNVNHKIHPNEYIEGQLWRWYDQEGFSTISLYNTDKDTTGRILNFNIFFKSKPLN